MSIAFRTTYVYLLLGQPMYICFRIILCVSGLGTADDSIVFVLPEYVLFLAA